MRPGDCRLLVIVSILLLSACSANSSQSDSKARTSGAAVSSSVAIPVPVTYGRGFFNAERDDTGLIWRWMTDDGIVTVRNDKRDVHLRLSASAPIAKAVLRLELNGELLDEFALEGDRFEKAYDIPAARLGVGAECQLHLTTSAVLDAQHDPRHLGLRVFEIAWTAK